MSIQRVTEAKLELKAERRPALPQPGLRSTPGATLQHTDDAALLYSVGGNKAVFRQGDERVELDLAQLKHLYEHLPEVIADLEPKISDFQ